MRMKELRNKKGLSGPQIAEILHITPTHYYDIEKGKKRVHGEMLSDIADILETSTDYLLGRTNNPSPPENIKPLNYDEMVLSSKNLADALIAIATLKNNKDIPDNWFNEILDKAVAKYGIPEPAQQSEPAAHGPNTPGTGIRLNDNDQ